MSFNNLLSELNPEQLRGVTHESGPLLIVAGAGTGKTTVITRRVSWLIMEQGVKPEEILALTFTEKAAAEMEERVDLLLPYGYVDLWISTFHSFCERLLREHGLEIGIPNEFTLLNQTEQWLLVKKNLEKFDLDYYRPLGNPTKFIHALLKHFSRAKDELVTPEEYLKYAEGLIADQDSAESTGGALKKKKLQITNDKLQTKSKIQNSKQTADEVGEVNEQEDIDPVKTMEIAKAYHTYQRLLLDSGSFDFGDLINYTYQLFVRRPAILKRYQDQFKHILVDEFQDTNYAQYQIIKLLAGSTEHTLALIESLPEIQSPSQEGNFKVPSHGGVDRAERETGWVRNANLTVVGDDDQAIYRFRGASMSNILLFKKDFSEAEQLLLTKNYRTKQNILNAAYQFIQLNNPNRLEYQFNVISTEPRAEHSEVEGEVEKSHNGPSPANDEIPRLTMLARDDRKGMSGLSKKLEAQNHGQGTYEVLHFSDEHTEARKVVKEIIELSTQEKQWSDFAILVRSNAQARSFEKYLYEANIPYQFMASRGLYTKRVVLDIVNYLKLLDNYHESPSLWRIVTMPIWTFHHEDLVKLSHLAKKKNHSLFLVFTNEISELAWAKESLASREKLLQLVRKHTEESKRLSVSKIVLNFLNDSGYLKYLAQDSNQHRGVGAGLASAQVGAQHIVPLRAEINPAPTETLRDQQLRLAEISYLNQFFKKVKSFEDAVPDPSVKNFIELMDMEIESGEEGGLTQDIEEGPDTVKVMTVHGAKGLEFDTVFIPQLVDKRFPSVSRGEPIELPEPLVKDILSKGDFHLEEERRLLYVAMTRAKSRLFLSYADDYGGMTKKKPSRFLYELGLVKNNQESRIKNQEGESHGIPSTSSGTNLFPERSEAESKGFNSEKLLTTHYPLPTNHYSLPTHHYSLPTKFSFTQIKAFTTCPYQYRFAHILKIPTKGSGTFSFGQSLHVTLQKFFERYLKGVQNEQKDLFGLKQSTVNSQQSTEDFPSYDTLLQLLEESWISDWYDSAWQEEGQKKKAKELLKGFYQEFVSAPPKTLFLERDFNLKITADKKSYTFKGKIDRIDDVQSTVSSQQSTKTVELIDYKTGKTRDLDVQDKRQLLLYQLAAKEVLGLEPVRLTYYYLEENKKVSFLGDEKALADLKNELVETVEKMKVGDFHATPGVVACKYCDFREICEYRVS